MSVILIPHTQTTDNLVGPNWVNEYYLDADGRIARFHHFVDGPILSGANDVGLTPYGVRQAAEIGVKLFELTDRVDLLANSGLMRTRLTDELLRLTFGALGGTIGNRRSKPYEYPLLQERNPGRWINKRRAEVPKAELAPLRDPYERYRNGESLYDVAMRAGPVVDSLRNQGCCNGVVIHEVVYLGARWFLNDFVGNPLDKENPDPLYAFTRGEYYVVD
jgi:broad specificity phosphatase PhoE